MNRPYIYYVLIFVICIWLSIYLSHDLHVPTKKVEDASYKKDLAQTYKECNNYRDDLSSVHKSRKIILENGCKKYQNRTEFDRKERNHFLVKQQLRFKEEGKSFIWCKIPKVGSSSWNHLFIQTYFPNVSGKKHQYLRQQWAEKHEEDFYVKASHDTFSFLFTRHPFERLLSAFRDKFEDQAFARIYVPDILPRYRKEKPKDKKYENSPTFPEFIDYLIDLEIEDINEHFMPFYYICMPCHMDYDIIGRTDTMDADSEPILKHLQIEKPLEVNHVTHGGSTDNYLQEFYSEVSKEQLDKLYKLYEMDFVLFDYNPDSFYELVKH